MDFMKDIVENCIKHASIHKKNIYINTKNNWIIKYTLKNIYIWFPTSDEEF